MKPGLSFRILWIAGTIGLILVLFWLDQNRGGPASLLARCNLFLSRSESPAANVLVIGSSRSGTALDPVAMQEMFGNSMSGEVPKVERLALGPNPLRASLALMENYFKTRGAPDVIVLEVMFLTRRTVDRLSKRGFAVSPEQYIFRRDLNLMTFKQILKMPSVAMPFSEGEGLVNQWRFRMNGIALRSGALVYQFLKHPIDTWNLSICNRDAWKRDLPSDFLFGYGDFKSDASIGEVIEALEISMDEAASERELKSWQTGVVKGKRYPYDFRADYRIGEVTILKSMLDQASRYDVPVVLLPLPLYGYTVDFDDLTMLSEMASVPVPAFDLYGHIKGDLDKFWYDDGHIEIYPAGALTTAILAQHLLDSGFIRARETATRE